MTTKPTPNPDSSKDSKITRMIQSFPMEIINKRFQVKVSIFDNGVHPRSIMVVVFDLLESGFTIKFHKTDQEAANLLNLLKSASK